MEIGEFNWDSETHLCSGCINAHLTDMCRNTPFTWCNEVRQYITPQTQSWLCHNQHYKNKYSTTNTIVKKVEKEEQIPGQLSFLEVIQ